MINYYYPCDVIQTPDVANDLKPYWQIPKLYISDLKSNLHHGILKNILWFLCFAGIGPALLDL